MTDADAQSTENKIRYLIDSGVVQPTMLEIPLDADLCELYIRTAGASHVMTPAEILMVHVIRLLRANANGNQPTGGAASVGEGSPSAGTTGQASDSGSSEAHG
jgi:hypothetical protein